MRREQGIAAPHIASKARRPIEISDKRGGRDQIVFVKPLQRPRRQATNSAPIATQAGTPMRITRPAQNAAAPSQKSASFYHRSRGARDNQISRNHEKQIHADPKRGHQKDRRKREVVPEHERDVRGQHGADRESRAAHRAARLDSRWEGSTLVERRPKFRLLRYNI